MAVSVPNDVFKRLYESGVDLKTDADVIAAMRGETAVEPGELADVLGGEYAIGNVNLPPVHLGHIPNLEIIDSPFLNENSNEYTLRDLMNAAYVLAKGRAVVRNLAALSRRKEALEKYRSVAEKSPDTFRVFLEKVDALESEWTVFEDGAAAFWETIGPVNLEEVAQTVLAAISHAFSGMATLPQGEAEDADTPKKKQGSTLNG